MLQQLLIFSTVKYSNVEIEEEEEGKSYLKPFSCVFCFFFKETYDEGFLPLLDGHWSLSCCLVYFYFTERNTDGAIGLNSNVPLCLSI